MVVVCKNYNMNKEGNNCPHCNNGVLELIKEDYPWTIDHLQCSYCESTFVIEDV